MREKWTGDLVGRMHNAEIKNVDLARELGVGKSYISMILNGEKAPKNAETRLNAAFYAVLNRKLEEEKHAKNKV
jgi:transcriptional regulator with XRE-family HTH domain|nr:MAG TPA: antitoxin [Caudoviricetes sp.]DAY58042.1 MAG TPA: antitoxin [Caudoviricetes sp.]